MRRQVINREPEPDENGNIAWLVVHTEGMSVESFGLKEGENPVGRKAVPGKKNCISIPDPYMSRYHCVFIIAPARGQMSAAVGDDGRYSNGKISVNGTYVNGSEARISMTRIKEDDTIQIGVTKLVFKWNVDTQKNIEDEVSHTGYIKTVSVGGE